MSIIGEIVYYVSDQYWDEHGDPRVNDWPLIRGGPWRILLLILSYLLITTIALPKFMSKRPAFQLKRVILVYDILMSSVNGYIFLCLMYTIKTHLSDLSDFNYPDRSDVSEQTTWLLSIARLIIYSHFFPTEGWICFLSRLLYLLETVFFVLRKKQSQVTPLHLYHHSIVPILAFSCTKHNPMVPIIRLFLILNTLTHFVMYGYYALSSLGPPFNKYLWWKKYITLFEIYKFVIVGVYGVVLYFKQTGYPMDWFVLNVGQSAIFLPLFINYYLNTYCSETKSKLKSN